MKCFKCNYQINTKLNKVQFIDTLKGLLCFKCFTNINK